MNMNHCAQRIVNCPLFRWIPGMTTIAGKSLIEYSEDCPQQVWLLDEHGLDGPQMDRVNADSIFPDLYDEHTVDCLLKIINDHIKPSKVVIDHHDSLWYFDVPLVYRRLGAKAAPPLRSTTNPFIDLYTLTRAELLMYGFENLWAFIQKGQGNE